MNDQNYAILNIKKKEKGEGRGKKCRCYGIVCTDDAGVMLFTQTTPLPLYVVVAPLLLFLNLVCHFSH
jgi:hypothetical protein